MVKSHGLKCFSNSSFLHFLVSILASLSNLGVLALIAQSSRASLFIFGFLHASWPLFKIFSILTFFLNSCRLTSFSNSYIPASFFILAS